MQKLTCWVMKRCKLEYLVKGALETWTINFLQSRVATANQDNLIQRFQNVVATRIEDYYDVTYEVVVNSEITKIFFTGFLLKIKDMARGRVLQHRKRLSK